MAPFLHTFADDGACLQDPAAVGVVMLTVLRPTLADALRSVLAQKVRGRVHVLLGLDRPGDIGMIEAACRERPPGFTVQVLWPGYSTAARNGGLHHPEDGGALRCMLTHLANSRRVAYLDDDNWWAPGHLQTLADAMAHTDWAYSLRWFVQPGTRRPVCVDTWESVGPGCGVFTARYGGFVDPNCLMLDKLACADAVAQWIGAPGHPGMATDRLVFERLRHRPGTGTGQPSVFYELRESDGMHPARVARMGRAWADLAGVG